MPFYLGLDFGTSGARAIAIDSSRHIAAEAQYPFNSDASGDRTVTWKTALFDLLDRLPSHIRHDTAAIAINGTSSTVLLCDGDGTPVEPPLLYNDGRGGSLMAQMRAIAPANHPVLSASSSFAKLLWWRQNSQQNPRDRSFLHQADWLAYQLHGQLGISDYHNALKLGYDANNLCYPDWLRELSDIPTLPQVVTPGDTIGSVTPEISRRFEFPRDCRVCGGTTDSIAAFIASGANSPGEAVTSLGSTLVLKLLSRDRVDDPNYGIYSHRFGDLWLPGGASNTGGAVLKQFFTDEELDTLSRQIPDTESSLDYYPLVRPGERFPIHDPHLPPKLDPKPADPVEFLHGLLESIARIEAQGYRRLQELGATSLAKVYTAGGGAKNPTWTAIRERHLKVPVTKSACAEAAYGTALLALRGMAD